MLPLAGGECQAGGAGSAPESSGRASLSVNGERKRKALDVLGFVLFRRAILNT